MAGYNLLYPAKNGKLHQKWLVITPVFSYFILLNSKFESNDIFVSI